MLSSIAAGLTGLCLAAPLSPLPDNPDAGGRAGLSVAPTAQDQPIRLRIRSSVVGGGALLLASPGNGPHFSQAFGQVLRLDSKPTLVAAGSIGADGRFEVQGPAAPPDGSELHFQALVDLGNRWLVSNPVALTVGSDLPPGFSNDSARIPERVRRARFEDIDPADVDGDGDDDLVLSGRGAPLILRNDQGVLVEAARPRWTSVEARRGLVLRSGGVVELADVDADGDPDLFWSATDARGTHAFLFLNDGAGAFVQTAFPPSGARPINDAAFGDIDGDGDLDLVVCRGSGGAHGSGRRNALDSLYLNDGSGRFHEHLPFRQAPWNIGRRISSDISLGDIDADGDLDLYFATNDFSNGGAWNVLLRNDGGLNFTDLSSGLADLSPDNAVEAEFVDVDDDGDLDLLIAQSVLGAPGIPLQLNDGTGIFHSGAAQFPDISDLDIGVRLGMAVGDADGDGDLDILYSVHEIGIPPGESLLIVNAGGAQGGTLGHFEWDMSFRTFGKFVCSDAAFFDLENDGDQDLYLLNTGDVTGQDRSDRLLINDH